MSAVMCCSNSPSLLTETGGGICSVPSSALSQGKRAPGEVRGGGVLLGLAQAVEAIRVHARGEIGVLGQQRRIHPRLGVPEDVAVIPIGGQTGGGDAPVHAVAGVGPQVELRRVDVGGHRVVAQDVDTPVPQRRPGGLVGGEGRVVAVERARGGLGLRGRHRGAGVLRVVDADELGEGVGLPGGHREADLLADVCALVWSTSVGVAVTLALGLQTAGDRRLDAERLRLDVDEGLARGGVKALAGLVAQGGR